MATYGHSNVSPGELFSYRVVGDPTQVARMSRSVYYPVTLAAALAQVLKSKQRTAVIALPCFVTALRLAQRSSKELRSKLVLVAGLVCGQTRTRGFAEYVAAKSGIAPEDLHEIVFRQKSPEGTAADYRIRMEAAGRSAMISLSGFYGETRQRGLFTPRACTFCDDVFAELADVSLMDAWLPEYARDPAGTSIVVTRSGQAEAIVQHGIAEGRLCLTKIPLDKVLQSQTGAIALKRRALAKRLWLADTRGLSRPQKRTQPAPADRVEVRSMDDRERLRSASLAHYGLLLARDRPADVRVTDFEHVLWPDRPSHYLRGLLSPFTRRVRRLISRSLRER